MKNSENKCKAIRLNPIAASLLMLMPVMAQAADIAMVDGNVTRAANGTTIVNIKAPNSKGISHNIYQTLNVNKEGLILNNAGNTTTSQPSPGSISIFEKLGLSPATSNPGTTVAGKVTTTLGGQIDSNPNLTGGSTARVILNEVTSRKPSALNGMIEVAGDAAHVIIANPNGITTKDSGFINASKATLTTGTPEIKDGELKGYIVSDGLITVGGLQSTSPTEILARHAKITGTIQTGELTVIAGTNKINTQGVVTATSVPLTKISGFSVDVSRLGGMYANKISLISTEKGTGVRNEGTIGGGAGGVKITNTGKLVNSRGTLTSNGNIEIANNGKIDNTAGSILGDRMISIDSHGQAFTNIRGGRVYGVSNVNISSGALDNTNGKLASGATLAVNTNDKNLTNTGKGPTAGIEGAVVALETNYLSNINGQINGGSVRVKNSSVNNYTGIISSTNDIMLESKNVLDNQRGMIRSTTGNVVMKATNMNSVGSYIAGKNVTIESAVDINSKYSLIAATEQLNLKAGGTIDSSSADEFNNNAGKQFNLEKQKGGLVGGQGVTITSRKLNVDDGRILAQRGNVNITTSNALLSSRAQIAANAGSMLINSERVYADYSTLYSSGDLRINTTGLSLNGAGSVESNNRTGVINSDRNVLLSVNGNFSNSGWISGKEGVTLTSTGYMTNHGTINSEKDIAITAKSLTNNKDMTAGRTLNINATYDVTNNANSRISGLTTRVNAENVSNRGKLEAGSRLNVTANKNVYNYDSMFTAGNAVIHAQSIFNSGSSAVMGGASGLDVTPATIGGEGGRVVGL